MSKEIQIFKNEEFGQVRTLVINGEPYFVGKDVAEVLGYAKPLNAVATHVDEDDSLKQGLTDSLGRIQQTIVINESGLYSLILSSKLPNAKKFKRWVTSEVLPQIRKTGGYIPINEEDSEKDILAKAVLIANKTIEQKDAKIIELSSKNNELEEKIEDDKHKVSFAEAVENSDDVILVKEMATIITQNGFKIGQNQLFDYLRDYKYLCSKKGGMYNLPTKKHEDLFKVTKRTIQHTQGTEVKNTPKITGKGQLYFIKKFAEYKLQGLTIKDLLSKKQEAM
nr:phage antirepressor [Clostridium neonatale]